MRKWTFSLDSGKTLQTSIRKLKPYLSEFPETRQGFESFMRRRRTSRYVFIGGMVGFFAVAVATGGGESTNIVLASLGVGSFFGGIIVPFIIKPNPKDLIATIEKYNELSAKKTSFLQPLKPDYLKLGNAQGTAGISIGWHLGR